MTGKRKQHIIAEIEANCKETVSTGFRMPSWNDCNYYNLIPGSASKFCRTHAVTTGRAFNYNTRDTQHITCGEKLQHQGSRDLFPRSNDDYQITGHHSAVDNLFDHDPGAGGLTMVPPSTTTQNLVLGLYSPDSRCGKSSLQQLDSTAKSSHYELSPASSDQRNVSITIQPAQGCTSELFQRPPVCTSTVGCSVDLVELPQELPPGTSPGEVDPGSNSRSSITDSVGAVSYSEYSECVQAVFHNLISRQESSSNQGLTMSTGASTVHDHATGSSSANTTTDYLHQPISFSSTGGLFQKNVPEFHEMNGEQLLAICAMAIENNNAACAQQTVVELKRRSAVDGKPSERVIAYFLKALLCRAGNMQLDPDQHMPLKPDNGTSHEVQWIERKFSFNELTSFIDITPYYRFGYMAANGALLERFEGVERLHILDFSTTHCMQWPTFIDALADRIDGPPHVRLTVSSATPPRPPGLHSSYEELGSRLTAFAYSKSVPFEFHILTQPLETLCVSDIGLRDGEALGVNCAFRLHYLADESAAGPEFAANSCCPRDRFLQLIHSLNPVIVTLYEEDCDTTSLDLSWRLKLSFNYEWMPFDILATYPEYVSKHHRLEQEREVGQKIENIVACEGLCRIERLESKQQWHQRLHRLHFRALPVGEDVVAELKKMVADHAAGWGMKWEKSVDNTAVMLSWKGNSLAFASTWAPSSCSF